MFMRASKFEDIPIKILSAIQNISKSSFLLSSYFAGERFLFKGHTIQVQNRLNRGCMQRLPEFLKIQFLREFVTGQERAETCI